MDDAAPNNVTDSEKGEDQNWLWVKGPVYELTAGWHVYLWPAPTAWRGGTRLDKIVLLPPGKPVPKELGPASSPRSVADKAVIETHRFRLDDFRAWILTYDAEANGGSVVVRYSYDRGKTWQLAAKDKQIEIGRDERRLTFQVELARGANGDSPRIRSMVLVGLSSTP